MTDLNTRTTRKRIGTGRAALLAAAATAVLAGAAALAYVVGWGIADDKQPAAASVDLAKQMECTAVKREYDAWRKAAGLQEVERLRNLHASYATRKALDEGNALAKAVTGYDDEPSKVLAVAVGTYNVEVSMLNLQATATNDYDDVKYQDAMAAQGEVNLAFNNFWAKTCS